jgi:hypothetical protein
LGSLPSNSDPSWSSYNTKLDAQQRKKEMVVCTGHYININQGLRTLKRMQSKAIEWKLLRANPR